jgi:hypothetical protein
MQRSLYYIIFFIRVAIERFHFFKLMVGKQGFENQGKVLIVDMDIGGQVTFTRCFHTSQQNSN